MASIDLAQFLTSTLGAYDAEAERRRKAKQGDADLSMRQQELGSRLETEALQRTQLQQLIQQQQEQAQRMAQPVQFNTPYADTLGPEYRVQGPAMQGGAAPVSVPRYDIDLVSALLGNAGQERQVGFDQDYRNSMLALQQRQADASIQQNRLEAELRRSEEARRNQQFGWEQTQNNIQQSLASPSLNTVTEYPQWATDRFNALVGPMLEQAQMTQRQGVGGTKVGLSPFDTQDINRQAIIQLLTEVGKGTGPINEPALRSFLEARAPWDPSGMSDPNDLAAVEADRSELEKLLSSLGASQFAMPGYVPPENSIPQDMMSSQVPSYGNARQQAFRNQLLMKGMGR